MKGCLSIQFHFSQSYAVCLEKYCLIVTGKKYEHFAAESCKERYQACSYTD